MLCLSRKLGEKIHIGDTIITVVEIDRNKIRLGIEAPHEVAIYRGELLRGYDDAEGDGCGPLTDDDRAHLAHLARKRS